MVKNKNNKVIWGLRIKKDVSTLFQKVGNSIDIDKELLKEEILGSIAHVEMLFRQKIISFKIKNKITYGLNKIEKEILKNKFEYNRKYEDIHMNIEKRIFQIIGEVHNTKPLSRTLAAHPARLTAVPICVSRNAPQ